MRLIIAFLLAFTGMNTIAQGRPVIVELFTSEGCSSCPPADALLRQLNGTKSSSGDLIVGISEHVTYWNSLGWHDPFSSETITNRQQAYGQRLGLDDIYTPQVVVQGTTQALGSDRSAVLRAVEKNHRTDGGTLHIASVTPEAGGLTITFSLDGLKSSADIYAVIAEDTTTSHIERGENSGRTITHVAVARSLEKVATAANSPSKSIRIKLPPGTGTKRHLILFAQSPNLGPILTVDSAAL